MLKENPEGSELWLRSGGWKMPENSKSWMPKMNAGGLEKRSKSWIEVVSSMSFP